MGSYKENGDNHNILFCIFTLCTEHYTLEVTSGQNWPNYIGPKREKPPSLSNQASVHTLSPEGGWSGISLISLYFYLTPFEIHSIFTLTTNLKTHKVQ